MKIADILKQKEVVISFEMFPPKKWEGLEKTKQTARRMATLGPDFMSVTYGAGGGASDFTVSVAEEIGRQGMPALAHLTCVSAGRGKIDEVIEQLRGKKIENILALRGDLPAEGDFVLPENFSHATDLISYIKSKGDFCIGAACYPTGHPEAESMEADLQYLRQKQELGADFLTSQLFYDNQLFYEFRDRARKAGITVPILAGIMPITTVSQIERTIQLSSSTVPEHFRRLLERYQDNAESMRQAGILYAVSQIADLLANGQNYIHIYAMNKPDVVMDIMALLRPLILPFVS